MSDKQDKAVSAQPKQTETEKRILNKILFGNNGGALGPFLECSHFFLFAFFFLSLQVNGKFYVNPNVLQF